MKNMECNQETKLKDLLSDAIGIATAFHAGQRDKNDEIYILHPLRVMLQMDTYEEKIVAVLHDVLEDTDCTIESLQDRGFSEEIILALNAITRKIDEKYIEYIERVKNNELARKVKIKDLMDNLSREGTSEGLQKRYRQALDILDVK